jgi:hypothetical protein
MWMLVSSVCPVNVVSSEKCNCWLPSVVLLPCNCSDIGVKRVASVIRRCVLLCRPVSWLVSLSLCSSCVLSCCDYNLPAVKLVVCPCLWSILSDTNAGVFVRSPVIMTNFICCWQLLQLLIVLMSYICKFLYVLVLDCSIVIVCDINWSVSVVCTVTALHKWSLSNDVKLCLTYVIWMLAFRGVVLSWLPDAV